MRKLILLVIANYLLLIVPVFAQSKSDILTYKEYLTNILQYHPIAKQAELKIDLAKAEWLSAKGNLDPLINSNWNQKNFSDKLYYQHFEGKLKIPTQLGIDVIGGYENTKGDFLNPENSTDRYGLWNVAVEANLLQGLLVNERRTTLKQAKIYQNIAENQRQIILNELLYMASFAYLEWQKYHAYQQVINENIVLARNYLSNTKISFENGEKTAMDTLEARILFQDVNVLLQSNEATLEKSRQRLENFLWFKEDAVTLQENTIPQTYTESIFDTPLSPSVRSLVDNNPVLLEKLNKQSILEIEQKLKREKLKPKLKAKYNPLLATSDNSLAPNYSVSDYKWGFDFSMPLFLRSERANIQKGKIKLKENQLDIQVKQNELRNKVENSLQQQNILQAQLDLQEQNVSGYKLLLDGENEKFNYGESSVFLLNKRQEKYISGQLKLIGLNIKRQLEILDYLYFTNSLR